MHFHLLNFLEIATFFSKRAPKARVFRIPLPEFCGGGLMGKPMVGEEGQRPPPSPPKDRPCLPPVEVKQEDRLPFSWGREYLSHKGDFLTN